MNFKSVILSSIFISSILFSCATNKIESSSEFINDDSKDITYETFTEKNDYMEFSKEFHYDGESHNFWEMVYIDKGEMICTAGENKFTLKSGEKIEFFLR